MQLHLTIYHRKVLISASKVDIAAGIAAAVLTFGSAIMYLWPYFGH